MALTTVTGSMITPSTTLSGDVTVTGTMVMGSSFMRNRIINGAMVIDQRNAGASFAGGGYSLDRWYSGLTTNAWTSQRSTVAPTGFTNSLLVTVTTPQAPSTANLAYYLQKIEGFNTADFGWGTANAVTVTLSFWVRSSVTGTFAVAILNGAQNRSYVTTYTINSANTWEKETITIPGDTTGTWATDNSSGPNIFFDLGSGSNFQTTANSWQAGTFLRTSGSSNFANTSSATFYFTGVQLEIGTSATPFERRLYGQELANCQRYYYRIYPNENARPLSTSGQAYSTTGFIVTCQFPVPMRTRPTALEQSGTATHYAVFGAGTNAIACNSLIVYNAFTSNILSILEGTVASGLVSGNATSLNTSASTGSNAYLGWSAEL